MASSTTDHFLRMCCPLPTPSLPAARPEARPTCCLTRTYRVARHLIDLALVDIKVGSSTDLLWPDPNGRHGSYSDSPPASRTFNKHLHCNHSQQKELKHPVPTTEERATKTATDHLTLLLIVFNLLHLAANNGRTDGRRARRREQPSRPRSRRGRRRTRQLLPCHFNTVGGEKR